MVPLAWVASHGLLKREILLATKQILATDRCRVIGAFEHACLGDFQATPEGKRVGGIPTRFHHGPFEIVLRPNQLDVERIGRNAGAGVDDARNVLQLGVSEGVPLPAKGGNHVSGRHVDQGETTDNRGDPFPPIAGSWSRVHRHRPRSHRGSVPGSILAELELHRWAAFPRRVSGRLVHAKRIAFAAARVPRCRSATWTKKNAPMSKIAVAAVNTNLNGVRIGKLSKNGERSPRNQPARRSTLSSSENQLRTVRTAVSFERAIPAAFPSVRNGRESETLAW